MSEDTIPSYLKEFLSAGERAEIVNRKSKAGYYLGQARLRRKADSAAKARAARIAEREAEERAAAAKSERDGTEYQIYLSKLAHAAEHTKELDARIRAERDAPKGPPPEALYRKVIRPRPIYQGWRIVGYQNIETLERV